MSRARLLLPAAAALCAAAGIAVLPAHASPETPETAIQRALTAQRALGYSPCEPVLGILPAEDEILGTYADAGGTGPGETCEIRLARNLPASVVSWVAWHEVAHLSTMSQIMSDPFRPIVDPFHRHVAFLLLLSYGPTERGGY